MAKQPSVGRSVHYRAQGNEEPQHAVIVAVHDDKRVALDVVSSTGVHYYVADVALSEDAKETAGRAWYWPEFVPGGSDVKPDDRTLHTPIEQVSVEDAVRDAFTELGVDPEWVSSVNARLDDLAAAKGEDNPERLTEEDVERIARKVIDDELNSDGAKPAPPVEETPPPPPSPKARK